MAEIRFDVDYVGQAVNEIAEHSNAVAKLNQALLDKIDEEVRATRGDNAPYLLVQSKLQKEVENVNALIKTQEDIQETLDDYARRVDEANDTSELEALARND